MTALQKLQAEAGSVGFTVVPAPLKPPDELDALFAALAERPPDALQILQDSGTIDLNDRIIAQSMKQRLPAG